MIEVSFTVAKREKLGLVGESGSGKSLTALSLMRLLPPPGRIASGSVLLGGRDLTKLSEREMAASRAPCARLICSCCLPSDVAITARFSRSAVICACIARRISAGGVRSLIS